NNLQIVTVKKGDSLWELSQKYGVPLQSIIAANGLANQNVLVVGQAIIIPTPAEGISHRVVVGESLWKIAQRYGITLQQLQQANHLVNPALIFPGQVIVIPQAVKPVT